MSIIIVSASVISLYVCLWLFLFSFSLPLYRAAAAHGHHMQKPKFINSIYGFIK